jgi:hypothetical protein
MMAVSMAELKWLKCGDEGSGVTYASLDNRWTIFHDTTAVAPELPWALWDWQEERVVQWYESLAHAQQAAAQRATNVAGLAGGAALLGKSLELGSVLPGWLWTAGIG